MRTIIIGTGGMCKLVLDIVENYKRITIVGIADNDPAKHGTFVHGYKVICDVNGIQNIKGVEAVIIAVGENKVREEYFNKLSGNYSMISLIHPTASLHPSLKIGRGCIICRNVVIGPDVEIGDNTIMNMGTVVGHSTTIGNHCFIGLGVNLAGRNKIKDYVHLDVGCTIGPGKNVEKDIKPGAVVA